MAWYRAFSGTLLRAPEQSGRARALAVLRTMDPRFLRESGFSPELIQQGINAWPWRQEAIDWPQVPSAPSGSPEVVPETDPMAVVGPDEYALGHDDAPEVPVKRQRVDNDVAA